MDIINPRLSWVLESDKRDERQSAYRVLVASSPGLLEKDMGDLWDSEKVNSDQTLHIVYEGSSLLSRMEVWWKVKVWDRKGNPSQWSQPASWSMGLIRESDWEAQWIADPAAVSHETDSVNPNDALPATYIRKSFTIKSTVSKATAYISALGLYEFHLNGKRVGDQILSPEWTDYDKRVSYQTYDVTELISAGENVAGAILGEGWYAGRLMNVGRFPYGKFPRLLVQIEIEMDDGSHQIIVSNESWNSTTRGPIISSGIYNGETYDARLAFPGWDCPGFNDKKWSRARSFNLDSRRLVWLCNEPIRFEKELTPVKITEPEPGIYVVDFGQNMVGWCKLHAEGLKDKAISILHGEAIKNDGTLYTENLRGALQNDYYIPDADGLFDYEPRFTYHGFRYVELSGLSKPPALHSITGKVFHSSSPFAGKFKCSDQSLNRLMENIRWTMRGNLMSSPNDCPQRDERFGWMGDIQAFAQTGIFTMDMAAFFTKFLQDTRDDQADDGRFPDYAPHPGNVNESYSGVPAWGDAGVIVPWRVYQNYADIRLLAKQFSAARRWVDYVHRNNPNLIWANGRNNDYNDWLNGNWIKSDCWPKDGGEVPKEVFATAFFANSARIVGKMAEIVGRSEEADYYNKLADRIKDVFNKEFVSPDGRIKGNTQGGYALALNFNLLPEKLRQEANQYLVENINNRYNGHLSTGIQTTHRAMLELTRNGNNKLAWKLLTDHTFPSWLYMIDNGATTIWERWDGYVKESGYQDPGMNSFNHWALGSIGEWMWRNIIGLNPDDSQPGWKHFIIAPRPGGGICWASGEYHSIRGRIASSWIIKHGKFYLDVTVPPNTTATIRIPSSKADKITESFQVIIPVSVEEDCAVFEVESGIYHFSSQYKR